MWSGSSFLKPMPEPDSMECNKHSNKHMRWSSEKASNNPNSLFIYDRKYGYYIGVEPSEVREIQRLICSVAWTDVQKQIVDTAITVLCRSGGIKLSSAIDEDRQPA